MNKENAVNRNPDVRYVIVLHWDFLHINGEKKIMKPGFIKLKGTTLPEKTAEIVLLLLFTIYPLLSVKADTGSLTLQALMLFALIMGWMFANCLLIRKREWQLRKISSLLDWTVLLAAGYQLFRIIGKLFQDPNLGAIYYDAEVWIISLAVIYLLISTGVQFRTAFLELLLYAGLIVFGGLLYKYLCDINFNGPIQFIANDTDSIASFALLISAVSVMHYCSCKEKIHAVFYIGTALSSFLVLLINHNILSIWMLLALFLAIPVLLRPTAELVKRDMQLLFAFLFLLSNMSLLTNYTDILQTGLRLSLENSVYLDLLLALLCICFFQYWERIPEGVDLNKLVLRRMRKGYLFLLKLMGIVFAGVIAGGDRWSRLPDGIGTNAVKGLAVPVIEEMKKGNGTLFFVIEEQGLVTGIFLLFFIALMLAKLRRNHSFGKPVTGMLILISSLFMLQLLFWKPCINTLPIYFILLMFAAFNQEEKQKVSSRKIKFMMKEED